MELKSTRDGFGEAIIELAETNKDLVIVDADLKESLRVSRFAERYPERFIEVGVAEQNLVGVAAGLAIAGKTVFTTSFACFSPAICWNNIRIDICYSNSNVKIVGSHGGLATGGDGASHQALEDIALMRVLPNMVVLVPADYEQAKKLTKLAAEYGGPVYLRLARPETPVFGNQYSAFSIGGSEVLREGSKMTILGYGPVLGEALKAAEELEAEVINCYSVKPLDEQTILSSVKKTGKVITIEDHSIIGGLGGAVAEFLSQGYPVPIKMLGVKDIFGESARDYRELWQKYGLTAESIIKSGKQWT
jgi:transketolase